jgi:hypothetical protein
MIGIRAPELNQFESKRKRQPGPGGPKGQESLAQVYPGDAFFKVMGPEGAFREGAWECRQRAPLQGLTR